MQASNRRTFLKTAAGASVLAAPAIAGSSQSANDRIRVGIVGLRGRGKSHIAAIHELAGENVELAAMCDCDESNLNSALAAYEKRSGKRPLAYTDMRKLLDDDSIDAVSHATPNHWHTLGVIWTCQSGKHAYTEKPGTHNVHEGRKLIETARKYDRICQHGTQNRSSPNIVEGIAKLKEGVIGDVYMARGITYKLRGSLGLHSPRPIPDGLDWDMWCGPAPVKEYSNFHHQRWHWIWDFGNGDLGNQGVHELDIIRWGMEIDDHPTKIQSMGGKYTHEDDAETPMVQNASFQWQGRNILVEFAVRNWYTNSEAGFRDQYPFVQENFPVGVIFLGTEGFMILPDYSSYYTFLGPNREPGPFAAEQGHPISDLPHFQNWVKSLRSGNPDDLTAEIAHAHYSSTLCHLANIAYRVGRTIQFDPRAEQFPGDDEANGLLSRTPRPPYAVPEET